jgi:hypothetical protein
VCGISPTHMALHTLALTAPVSALVSQIVATIHQVVSAGEWAGEYHHLHPIVKLLALASNQGVEGFPLGIGAALDFDALLSQLGNRVL